MKQSELTHFDARGQAHMVDVGAKAHTKRIAVARGSICVNQLAYDKVLSGSGKKGDVLAVARIAAIQASKQTSQLIPLCHLVALTHVSVEFATDDAERRITLTAQAETVGQTGVEMEALTAVSVGLLTIYDMLKAVDRAMVIETIELLRKEGGQSGVWQR
ncbi:cyclic pyranopterin monophosphate synthase MoaC [Neisseriaceae bacterium ESL0693]|nr:cyclic pyranopterin monophosphate synthase MoaC [Neisseriaceae bacterium ESL0693]